MNKILSVLGAVMLLGPTVVTAASSELFVFDNGVGRDKLSPTEQAVLVREAGFAGIGYNDMGHAVLAERLKAFQEKGSKIFSIYVTTKLGDPNPLPADLEESMKLLQGTDTVIWMNINKAADPKSQSIKSGEQDQDAAQIVQSVSAMAKKYGLKVALYGHKGHYLETAEDALRISQKANCDNVGITFNLCHELWYGNQNRLPEIIKKTGPYLTMVSLSDADMKTNQPILPLGKGNFDVPSVVKELREAGYQGPIGLQCYGSTGDVKQNLQGYMEAWKKINE